MPAILVDSNVFLDVLTTDPVWFAWSARQLAQFGGSGTLVINPIIYAELSAGFDRIEDLDSALGSVRRDPLPWPAAFLAGQCYVAYRRRGGEKRSPLPDFYIGAHAAVAGLPLLTRDSARYRTYFPKLEIIAPK